MVFRFYIFTIFTYSINCASSLQRTFKNRYLMEVCLNLPAKQAGPQWYYPWSLPLYCCINQGRIRKLKWRNINGDKISGEVWINFDRKRWFAELIFSRLIDSTLYIGWQIFQASAQYPIDSDLRMCIHFNTIILFNFRYGYKAPWEISGAMRYNENERREPEIKVN